MLLWRKAQTGAATEVSHIVLFMLLVDQIVFSLWFGLAECGDHWSKGDASLLHPVRAGACLQSGHTADSWPHLQHRGSDHMWYNFHLTGGLWFGLVVLQSLPIGLNKSLVDPDEDLFSQGVYQLVCWRDAWANLIELWGYIRNVKEMFGNHWSRSRTGCRQLDVRY